MPYGAQLPGPKQGPAQGGHRRGGHRRPVGRPAPRLLRPHRHRGPGGDGPPRGSDPLVLAGRHGRGAGGAVDLRGVAGQLRLHARCPGRAAR